MSTISRPDVDTAAPHRSTADAADRFADRHIGPSGSDIATMLKYVDAASLDQLAEQTLPASIRIDRPLTLRGLPDEGLQSEQVVLQRLRGIADKNKVMRSCIGMGYYDTHTPAAVQRNILENPGWYTQYTPYQAEISQGRLEALLNFQTMVADLTALPLANSSLLDEGTAAAEAMAMCDSIARGKKSTFLVAADCHPQTIAVVQTRAASMGVSLNVAAVEDFDITDDVCGALVQYPNTFGEIEDYAPVADALHDAGALLVAATDLLALTLITPPGEWGADIAVGSAQRFGVPMGLGGPHAAFIATQEKHARKMPGRIVGVSRDSHGNAACRLAIQTREQHIKRDRATSNICTAQVLLAIIAGMYAVHHGPDGLRRIARRVASLTAQLKAGLQAAGVDVPTRQCFDTLTVHVDSADATLNKAVARNINLRKINDTTVGISLDETADEQLLDDLLAVFGAKRNTQPANEAPRRATRNTPFLNHPVFNSYHAEHELLRYITRLQSRDLSLTTSMIPLGSCTMKLNAAVEMLPITWPQFAKLHPFAPRQQWEGYAELFDDLETWLAEITGFAATSLQPNAGSQGEYAGLLAIRGYHEARGDGERNVCLIPVSAHGTNPASAVIAGFDVVSVACDRDGNIDVDDLRAKAAEHSARLGALMITYPSTHGVFEQAVKEICRIVHEHGGQVYMDGANMNAQVGLCKPADIGADVCHINLHKTFCIPHGGGGPGMGPICVAAHLKDHLPNHPISDFGAAPKPQSPTPNPQPPTISAAPYGSPSILPIPWVYIALMGADGLRRATQVAILNANYMARRLSEEYPVLYTGKDGRVAHEFIIDCRQFKPAAAVDVEDIAKRLMDYGFHAPTMSFPVAGTLMIEPTESESKAELDRLCDALISIRREIRAIEQADADLEDNPLKNAPHTAAAVTANVWGHPYSRQEAAYPADWLKDHKAWPPVGRIDNPYGDRNLFCTCPPMEAAAAEG